MSPALARWVVVVSGAAILVVETLTTRLVAPYVGLTLESTTAAIGVALLGIAAGAAWGGRLADRHPPRRVVAVALLTGGLLVLAVRPVVVVLGPVLGAGPVATVLLVACSTLPAVTALATVTPAATKARLRDVHGAGGVVGGLSAAGTLGSLAGVFLTGFVLVALLPLAAILAVAAAACLVLAAVAGRPGPRPVAAAAVAALLLGAGLVVVQGPCSGESTYYCARVVAGPGSATGRTLVLDDLDHSYVDLADPTVLRFAYTQRMADAVDTAFAPGAPLDAVHVGGGGFTMPRWLAATRPGTRSTVLELDAGVVELGRAELGVSTIPGVDVRTGDARTGLAALPDDSADLVVGDAFGSRSVPWHLATAELVAEVDRVLRPGGLYVLNVIDNDPLDFLRAEVATVASVLPRTGVVARAAQLGPGGGGNAVVVARAGELDWSGLAARAARREESPTVLDPAAAATLAAGAPVLTDDRAPVDQLLNPYSTRTAAPR
ncbi:hypothetical protein GCM10027047_09750 [Rhodococcus aerolatus]